MTQFDQFLADAGRNTDQHIADMHRAADARALASANEALRTVKAFNAGNLAMKHLLLRELAKLDPSHPLVRDAALRESVSAGAKKVMAATDHWDNVRDYGLNLKIPGR